MFCEALEETYCLDPKVCRRIAFFSGFWAIILPTFGGSGTTQSSPKTQTPATTCQHNTLCTHRSRPVLVKPWSTPVLLSPKCRTGSLHWVEAYRAVRASKFEAFLGLESLRPLGPFAISGPRKGLYGRTNRRQSLGSFPVKFSKEELEVGCRV